MGGMVHFAMNIVKSGRKCPPKGYSRYTSWFTRSTVGFMAIVGAINPLKGNEGRVRHEIFRFSVLKHFSSAR